MLLIGVKFIDLIIFVQILSFASFSFNFVLLTICPIIDMSVFLVAEKASVKASHFS